MATQTGGLFERLREYGADMIGIGDRFMGDEDLYRVCMQSIVEGEDVAALRAAIRTRDVKRAFEASHALKGAVANMGLTPLCQAVNALVESLRHQHLEQLDAEYEAVALQFDVAQWVVLQRIG